MWVDGKGCLGTYPLKGQLEHISLQKDDLIFVERVNERAVQVHIFEVNDLTHKSIKVPAAKRGKFSLTL